MGGRERSHSRRLLPAVLILLVVGGGAAAAYRFIDPAGTSSLTLPGPLDDGSAAPAPEPVELGVEVPEAPAPPAVADPLPRDAAGTLDRAKVQALLAPLRADPALGPRLSVRVADLSDGRALFAAGPAPVLPASTLKLLTSAAALELLGPDHVFTTAVVSGGPNRVVLVGGGDPGLLSKPAAGDDAADVYPPRADLVSIARATAQALGPGARVRVGYDTSLFSGPAVAPSWEPDYVPDEVVAPISALWVDEGRPPSGLGRVPDPSLRAGRVFAAALAKAGVTVVGPPRATVAPDDAEVLASVDSAPLERIVQRLLEVSDNEAAEVLLRHIGLASSGEGSFDAGIAGMVAALRALGVPLAGAEIHDGSGLSRSDRLDPRTLVALLRLAADPAHPELRPLLEGLPVAGGTGSLAERFTEAAAPGRGLVRAKTGTLTGVTALAGLVTDRDGSTAVFVVVADQVALEDTLAAREAVDRLAAALAGCRCG